MRIGRTGPPQATKQRSLIKQKVWQINTQQAAETLCFTHHTHTWNGVLLLRLATTKHRIHSYCKDSLSKTILVLRKGGAFPAWGVLSFAFIGVHMLGLCLQAFFDSDSQPSISGLAIAISTITITITSKHKAQNTRHIHTYTYTYTKTQAHCP